MIPLVATADDVMEAGSLIRVVGGEFIKGGEGAPRVAGGKIAVHHLDSNIFLCGLVLRAWKSLSEILDCLLPVLLRLATITEHSQGLGG